MKNYRPLLIQEVDVRIPGIRLRRLRLNRHLPEVDRLSRHAHGFSQILCYLSGRGTISAAERHAVAPGAVALVPPRVEHAFEETSGRRPLCLVLDLELRGAAKRGFLLGHLNLAEAAEVRRELATLTRLSDPNAAACRLVVAAVALRVADIVLRAVGVLPSPRAVMPPFVREFDRRLRQSPEAAQTGVAELARQLGYQPDYLNRVFKQATGRTLGEYRSAHLLERAKRLLREREFVKDVGAELGFADHNYFSRWFRRHTGRSPRAYRLGTA